MEPLAFSLFEWVTNSDTYSYLDQSPEKDAKRRRIKTNA